MVQVYLRAALTHYRTAYKYKKRSLAIAFFTYISNISKLMYQRIWQYDTKRILDSKLQLSGAKKTEFKEKRGKFDVIDEKLRSPRNDECHVVKNLEDVNEAEMMVHLKKLDQLSNDDVCVFMDLPQTIA